jgi:hypothetical protein
VEAEPEPQFRRQEVDYTGPEASGTIVVDTPERFLFLVEPHGKALRYGIGVGRPGFEWAGVKRISRKSEWPDWTPPAQMLLRCAAPTCRAIWRAARQSARRESPLSRVLALPHPWHQRAVDHRPQRLVRLYPDDERRCDRPLRSCARRHDGRGALKRKRRGAPEHASPIIQIELDLRRRRSRRRRRTIRPNCRRSSRQDCRSWRPGRPARRDRTAENSRRCRGPACRRNSC